MTNLFDSDTLHQSYALYLWCSSNTSACGAEIASATLARYPILTMILITRRLIAVLLFIPLMLMEFIWTLLKIVTMPISYILFGPSDKPHHGLVEIQPGEPDFERAARWCRVIAGDKNV